MSSEQDGRRRQLRTPGAPGMEKLLEQYGCGPIQFTGTGDALYERHLMFDNVVDPAAVGSARALRGRRPLRAGRPLAAVAAHRADLRAREPQARLLSLHGVPDRALAGQQRPQPPPRSRREAGRRRQGPRLARAARAGARRRPGQRRARPPRGVLPRLDGDDAAPGHGLRAALRVRHLQADDPRTAGSTSSRTTGCGGPIRGRSPGRRSRWRSSSAARSRCAAAASAWSPAGRRACSACRSIARWWATAARPSTRSGSGPPPRPTSSTSRRSAPASS